MTYPTIKRFRYEYDYDLGDGWAAPSKLEGVAPPRSLTGVLIIEIDKPTKPDKLGIAGVDGVDINHLIRFGEQHLENEGERDFIQRIRIEEYLPSAPLAPDAGSE